MTPPSSLLSIATSDCPNVQDNSLPRGRPERQGIGCILSPCPLRDRLGQQLYLWVQGHLGSSDLRPSSWLVSLAGVPRLYQAPYHSVMVDILNIHERRLRTEDLPWKGQEWVRVAWRIISHSFCPSLDSMLGMENRVWLRKVDNVMELSVFWILSSSCLVSHIRLPIFLQTSLWYPCDDGQLTSSFLRDFLLSTNHPIRRLENFNQPYLRQHDQCYCWTCDEYEIVCLRWRGVDHL